MSDFVGDLGNFGRAGDLSNTTITRVLLYYFEVLSVYLIEFQSFCSSVVLEIAGF